MEIIIVTMIVATTAVVTLEFYALCVKRFIENSRLSLEAVDFGRAKMEELYFLSAAGLADGTVTTDSLPASTALVPNELKDRYAGTREYTVTSNPSAGYKVVETKVEWTP